jgi:hypothetical protein
MCRDHGATLLISLRLGLQSWDAERLTGGFLGGFLDAPLGTAQQSLKGSPRAAEAHLQ